MDCEPHGADWWLDEPQAVLVRIHKLGQAPYVKAYKPEDLQRVMDKAATQFFDPERPQTRPVPSLPPSPPISLSRRRSFRPT